MRLRTEISWTKLRLKCKTQELSFTATDEIQLHNEIIGQGRAANALKFGLNMRNFGYNIFVCGPNGTGKNTYVKTVVKEFAKSQEPPCDWCYVYNFEEAEKPIAISFPKGSGVVFKNDIDQLISNLKEIIPKVFSNPEFEKIKNTLIDNYFNKSDQMYEELEKTAQADGFTITKTSNGLASTPVQDGKALSEEEYDALPDKDKEQWVERSKKIQYVISNFVKVHRVMEKEFKGKLTELDQELGLTTAERAISKLKNKYSSCPSVSKYLKNLQVDISKNIDIFLPKEEELTILSLGKKTTEDVFNKYNVNLIVDNANTDGVPVVIESIPNYQNIMGFIEYHGEFGLFVTDFGKIKRGALHRANGGYLILQAADILKYPLVWDALKTALINKELRISDLNKNIGVSVATLYPEPIPLELKVILIGDLSIYYLLQQYDPDFSKLFKIKAEFDTEMERTKENIAQYAAFVAAMVKQNSLKAFTKSAVARIVEFGSEEVADQGKLTTRFNKVSEIVFEANQWAKIEGAKKVSADYVDKAIAEKALRLNQIEEKMQRLIAEGSILIDVRGEKLGEVNALSVYNLGDYSFGRPVKITAKTYMGRNGVVNIEREADLSGSIHNKGVLILSGYLGDKFAKEKPLAMSASLAFEQSYAGIDGDSASAAELIAILSSLAGITIKQEFAITGSINQNGDIQPIGGLNEKIEGFYRVCRELNFNTINVNGVIIPRRNIHNLMLSREVVEAAKAGTFIIHAINHIDEAVVLLTGKAPKEVYNKVDQRLLKWAQDAKIKKKRKNIKKL